MLGDGQLQTADRLDRLCESVDLEVDFRIRPAEAVDDRRVGLASRGPQSRVHVVCALDYVPVLREEDFARLSLVFLLEENLSLERLQLLQFTLQYSLMVVSFQLLVQLGKAVEELGLVIEDFSFLRHRGIRWSASRSTELSPCQ